MVEHHLTDSEIVVSNTGFLVVGEVTTRALSLALVFAIARYLGDIGLGVYAFVFAFTDLLLNVIDLGIPMYINREMAKNRAIASSYLGNVLGLRLIMSPFVLGAGAFAALAAFFMQVITLETLFITVMATVGMALSFLIEPFRIVFISHERGSYYSGLLIFERLVFAGIGLGLLVAGYSLKYVMAAFIFSQLISLFTAAYLVRRKFVKFTIRFDKAIILHIVKNSLSFWTANFLRVVHQRIDTLMLSLFQGFAATGLYGAAYKLTEALRFIPIVVVTAIFPTVSRLHAQSKESIKILYEKTFYYLLIVAIPMSVGLMIISEKIILFFYGPEFSASIITLKLLVLAESLLFLHYLMGFMLSAVGKQYLFTMVTATYTGASVALNLFLIPRYSYIGAAAAAVATQLIAVLMLYYYCTKNGYSLNLPRLFYKPLTSAAAMAAAILLTKQLHLLLIIPAAALTYVTVLAFLKGIGKDELNLTKALFGRITGKR